MQMLYIMALITPKLYVSIRVYLLSNNFPRTIVMSRYKLLESV